MAVLSLLVLQLMMVVMIIIKSTYCIYEKWKYKYLSQLENYLNSENKN